MTEKDLLKELEGFVDSNDEQDTPVIAVSKEAETIKKIREHEQSMAKKKIKELKQLIKIVPILNNSKNYPTSTILYPGCNIVLTTALTSHGTLNHGLTVDEIEKLQRELGMKLDGFFFSEFTIILNDRGLELDLRNPMDYLKFKILSNHPWIANSKKEINSQSKFYIINTVEEAKIENEKNELKLKAMNIVMEKLTPVEREELITLFGYKSGEMMPQMTMKILLDTAEQNYENFLKVYNDPYKNLRILIQKAVQYHIVNMKAGSYYFDDILLGTGNEYVIQFLTSPSNKVILDNLENRVLEYINNQR